MAINQLVKSLVVVLAATALSSPANAYEVMVSTNTLRKSKVPDALNRIGELAADGAWFIPGNSDFGVGEWQHMLRRLHGKRYTEDVLTSVQGEPALEARNIYRASFGRDAEMAFVYNEHLGQGATVLDAKEIDIAWERYGRTPILPLTRSYAGGPWADAVDAVIDNPKVGGLVIEPTRGAALEEFGPGIDNGLYRAINMVLEKDKKIFVLIHTGGDEYYQGHGTDPWRDEHHRAFLQKLDEKLSDRIASDNLIIVPQLYDVHEDEDGRRTSTDRWFGDSESVKSAIAIYTSHAHYTGNTPKRFIKSDATGDFALDGNHDGNNGQNVYLWESSPTNVNQQWEEVDQGNGYYSYLKKGTRFALDGGHGGSPDQNVYLWEYNVDNINQHWRKVDAGDGSVRLEKRDTNVAISTGPDAANQQNVFLSTSSESNTNQQWRLAD